MLQEKKIPRGIRNNNPLNIRIGNVWLGERPNPTDRTFEEFVTMAYGLRAAFIILRRYIKRYQLNTIAKIIPRWSPDGEEKERAYIEVVCHRSGHAADTPLTYENKATMVALVEAMAYVECGVPISRTQIENAYEIA
mgnify:CR=1 FL=1